MRITYKLKGTRRKFEVEDRDAFVPRVGETVELFPERHNDDKREPMKGVVHSVHHEIQCGRDSYVTRFATVVLV